MACAIVATLRARDNKFYGFYLSTRASFLRVETKPVHRRQIEQISEEKKKRIERNKKERRRIERQIKRVNSREEKERERENETPSRDDEGSIGWLAVSGWVSKLKSFGGIRERDVESSMGVRAVAEKGEEVARGIRGTGRREIWSRVGGVPGGHFERIYRLFGGRAPLGHSQGWLVCHITNPRSAVSLLASHKEKWYVFARVIRLSCGHDTGPVRLDVS